MYRKQTILYFSFLFIWFYYFLFQKEAWPCETDIKNRQGLVLNKRSLLCITFHKRTICCCFLSLFSVDGFYDDSFRDDFKVLVEHNGFILWEFGGHFKTRCAIRMKLFPYDTQTCELVLDVWVHTIDYVNMFATDPADLDPLLDRKYVYNSLWEMKDKSFTDEDRIFENYATVRFSYTFKRKPLYYIVNVILPILFLFVVSLGVFWLPAESGEKASLGISLLLASSVFQLILTGHIPVNSDVTPNISKYRKSQLTTCTLV